MIPAEECLGRLHLQYGFAAELLCSCIWVGGARLCPLCAPGAQPHLQLLYQLHLQGHEHVEQLRDVLAVFQYLHLDVDQVGLISNGV